MDKNLLSLSATVTDAHPEFFAGGERGVADPETICNLRLILKIMLQKSFVSTREHCLQLHLYT
jgi:hypothetical protein